MSHKLTISNLRQQKYIRTYSNYRGCRLYYWWCDTSFLGRNSMSAASPRQLMGYTSNHMNGRKEKEKHA